VWVSDGPDGIRKKIFAHKIVLATGSWAFKKLFQSQSKVRSIAPDLPKLD
jgi:hypothetical protein